MRKWIRGLAWAVGFLASGVALWQFFVPRPLPIYPETELDACNTHGRDNDRFVLDLLEYSRKFRAGDVVFFTRLDLSVGATCHLEQLEGKTASDNGRYEFALHIWGDPRFPNRDQSQPYVLRDETGQQTTITAVEETPATSVTIYFPSLKGPEARFLEREGETGAYIGPMSVRAEQSNLGINIYLEAVDVSKMGLMESYSCAHSIAGWRDDWRRHFACFVPYSVLSMLNRFGSNQEQVIPEPVVPPANSPVRASGPVALPLSESQRESGVVSNFYEALGRGDGVEASSYIVPERRVSGPFSASELTNFYSSLSSPLVLKSVTKVGDGQYEARYSFSASSGNVCDGKSVVTVAKRDGVFLIERIQALNGC